mgnify:CR=1 FL=1
MNKRVKQFEKAIIAKGLTPTHLIVSRSGRVKWFACKDTRPSVMYALVVYDSQGRALVLAENQEPDGKGGELLIETFDKGVRINGQVPYRDSSLDLFTEETEEHL